MRFRFSCIGRERSARPSDAGIGGKSAAREREMEEHCSRKGKGRALLAKGKSAAREREEHVLPMCTAWAAIRRVLYQAGGGVCEWALEDATFALAV